MGTRKYRKIRLDECLLEPNEYSTVKRTVRADCMCIDCDTCGWNIKVAKRRRKEAERKEKYGN